MNARLADVEKGLAIAATMEVMGSMPAPGRRDGDGTDRTAAVSAAGIGSNQPEVGDWSTAQIIACISKCKERAAKDPEFAALIERDPAAAVREVQA